MQFIDDHMDVKKIVLVSAVMFPRNSPRANRTTELAKEFARQGHDVTIYAITGDYDYSDFEKEYNIKVKNLGSPYFYSLASDGKSKSNLFKKIVIKLFGRALDFPRSELTFKVSKVLKHERNVDLLITIAVPYSIHWGAAHSYKNFATNNIKTWVADCGDPFMGNEFKSYPFYFEYIEKWFYRKTDYITIPLEDARKAYYEEFLG